MGAIRGYLANTDPDWFDFLSDRGDDEVNFWTPSGRPFKALTEGLPLLFRLKSPRNCVGGFGIFERFTLLPDWLAWQTFGPANGCASLPRFTARLDAIRSRNTIEGPRVIGCLLLAQPVFLPPDRWVDLPPSWHPNIVSGKGYDLSQGEGRVMWQALLQATRQTGAPLVADDPEMPRYGSPQLVQPRLGQAGFRVAVLDAYGRSCAVTTEHSLPVLEAAHIQPYAEGGEHAVHNGLLLRSDIHRLFDRGYVTVTPDHRFEVSGRLRDDFANGRTYYHLAGQPVHVPDDPALHPARQALEWHRDMRYLG